MSKSVRVCACVGPHECDCGDCIMVQRYRQYGPEGIKANSLIPWPENFEDVADRLITERYTAEGKPVNG